jgi:hypothetical protein
MVVVPVLDAQGRLIAVIKAVNKKTAKADMDARGASVGNMFAKQDVAKRHVKVQTNKWKCDCETQFGFSRLMDWRGLMKTMTCLFRTPKHEFLDFLGGGRLTIQLKCGLGTAFSTNNSGHDRIGTTVVRSFNVDPSVRFSIGDKGFHV